jgi:hypothetical protein
MKTKTHPFQNQKRKGGAPPTNKDKFKIDSESLGVPPGTTPP